MDNNYYYRLFFISFYYFSVIIAVNLFVAFVLDMYSSVERMDSEKSKHLDMLEEQLSGKQNAKEEKDEALFRIAEMQ